MRNQDLGRSSRKEFEKSPKLPVIAVLDNIRSLNNIGSVFRSADAFRIEAIWMTGFTASPPHREIQKTALGATETVKWEHLGEAVNVKIYANEMNYAIICVEQTTGSIPLSEFEPRKYHGLILVFGNEVDGVSSVYLDSATQVIEIPQEGTKHSLNVAVTAGIVFYDVFNKLK